MYHGGADFGVTSIEDVVIDVRGRAAAAKLPPVPREFFQGSLAGQDVGYSLNDRRSGRYL
jgi:hypothetical protein